ERAKTDWLAQQSRIVLTSSVSREQRTQFEAWLTQLRTPTIVYGSSPDATDLLIAFIDTINRIEPVLAREFAQLLQEIQQARPSDVTRLRARLAALLPTTCTACQHHATAAEQLLTSLATPPEPPPPTQSTPVSSATPPSAATSDAGDSPDSSI